MFKLHDVLAYPGCLFGIFEVVVEITDRFQYNKYGFVAFLMDFYFILTRHGALGGLFM